jgi:DNA-binding CsgD family transcriptional regulator
MREARALARLRGQRRGPIEITEPSEEIWEAIASLPTRQLQMIVLVVVQDLRIDDVAELLGCGAETVRTHLRRGCAHLAQLLTEDAQRTSTNTSTPHGHGSTTPPLARPRIRTVSSAATADGGSASPWCPCS